MAVGKEKSIDDILANMTDSGSYLELTALLSKWQLDIRKVRKVIASNSEAKPYLSELEKIISRLTEDVELKSELFDDIQLKSDDNDNKSDNKFDLKPESEDLNFNKNEVLNFKKDDATGTTSDNTDQKT
ncbi:hypothetical protein [Natranaerofaba carboxydovora]|uniref:hypothetical protein n=1 Tax=Natranaerofaba carboxydovora TaxID=2742683 RepID=UPI001F13EDAA|nr:hypothetical protein [Natranaerofaba carboxydovora]UMZ73593.1 hypothetical protein ACONDI_01155 [Natranaerofaba carboxydovora]